MKLFYLPHSCSQAPHILLNEIGAKFELEKMNKADRSSILKYNPKALVPTLVLNDGRVLTEASVILQYIADLKPELNLIPKIGTWERYQCMEWLNYVSTEIHKSIGVLFNPEFDEKAKETFKKNATKKLTWLNEHLGKNDFLMGKHFTAPDAYAFVTINWTKVVGIDISGLTNLVHYLERIKSRPSVNNAIREELK